MAMGPSRGWLCRTVAVTGVAVCLLAPTVSAVAEGPTAPTGHECCDALLTAASTPSHAAGTGMQCCAVQGAPTPPSVPAKAVATVGQPAALGAVAPVWGQAVLRFTPGEPTTSPPPARSVLLQTSVLLI
jgi:hypothetical protein